MKLTDLYYGVCLWDSEKQDLKTINLFCSTRVLRSVAMYRVGKFDEYRNCRDSVWFKGRTYLEDFASWCFGDTRARYQWEFGFGEPFKKDDGSWEGIKTDVFTAYVLPNIRLLKKMVDEVSVTSCKEYLREDRKRYRRTKS